VAEEQHEHHEPALPKIAAGVAIAAAGVRLGAGAAITLGGAGYLFESIAEKTWAELRPHAKRRAVAVLEAASDAAGCENSDEFGDLIGKSEHATLMTGLAMSSAERTAWPPKAVALGRVLAAGLIAEDEAKIDLQQLALSAMADMERPHVQLLDLLVNYQPDAVMQVGWRAVAHRVPSYISEYIGGGGELIWSAGFRIWTAKQLSGARPQLGPALMGLLGTLERHGLARLRDSGPEMAKRLAISLGTERQPSMQAIQPSWSPTELGERVRGFYDDAVTDADNPAPGSAS
jgi:hypothetical protein